jgi:hypothetical protein
MIKQQTIDSYHAGQVLDQTILAYKKNASHQYQTKHSMLAKKK